MRHNDKIGGQYPVNACKQPYYLKHMPGNPYFGCVHDGISTEYGKGYSVKPMNWLYRWRNNISPRGSTPLYLRNPGGKTKHWLEISVFEKVCKQTFVFEGMPHFMLFATISAVTIWHCARYLVSHPELTLYNVAMYPTKVWLEQQRTDKKEPMDKPAFRWFQRAPEFYCYDSYRELIDMGIIANDPYIEYMKSIGKERDLTLFAEERGWGEGGAGKIVDLLPREWRWSHGNYAKKEDKH